MVAAQAGHQVVTVTGMSQATGEGPAPVFLLGLPRSGTTLLSALLNQHPDITVPPEPWLLLAAEAFSQVPLRHPAGAALIHDGVEQFCRTLELQPALARFAAELYARRRAQAGARLLVDKTPRYYQILPFVDRLFPDAKRLVLLRNPFAVLASFKTSWSFDILADRRNGRRSPLYFDLALGSRILADLAEREESRRLVVRYEDLVRRPAGVLDGVQAFLDVAPAIDATRLETADFAGSRLGDQKILQTRSIHAGSLDKWAGDLSLDELQAGYDLLGSALLHRLGYADALDRARALGLVERDEETIAANVAALRADFEARRRDCRVTAETSDDVARAVDVAHADPRVIAEAPARMAWLAESLDSAVAERDRLGAERDRLGAECARFEGERDQARGEADWLKTDHAHLAAELEATRQHRDSLGQRLAVVQARNLELRAFLEAALGSRVIGRYLRMRKWPVPALDSEADA